MMTMFELIAQAAATETTWQHVAMAAVGAAFVFGMMWIGMKMFQ